MLYRCKYLHNRLSDTQYLTSKFLQRVNHWTRGVARNLLYGRTKQGIWGTEVPAGSRGWIPVGVWGWSPQELETHAEYSTEQSHRLSQIAYCSESDYTLKKFPATTGGTCTHVPLATPLHWMLGTWIIEEQPLAFFDDFIIISSKQFRGKND